MSRPTRETLLAALSRNGSDWETCLVVPCWGGEELAVRIGAPDSGEADEPTKRQIRTLQALASRKRDLRRVFEAAVFAWYRERVHGTVDESYAPTLDASAQIWPMLGQPRVWVTNDGQRKSGRDVFGLNMECDWDPDHGLGVLFDAWKVVEIGHWGDTTSLDENDEPLHLIEVDDAELTRRLDARPGADRLLLHYCSITDEGMKRVAAMPALECLYLKECPSVTDAGLAHIAAGRPGLRILHLTKCTGLRKGCVEPLSQLECLELLVLTRTRSIGGKQSRALRRVLKDTRVVLQ